MLILELGFCPMFSPRHHHPRDIVVLLPSPRSHRPFRALSPVHHPPPCHQLNHGMGVDIRYNMIYDPRYLVSLSRSAMGFTKEIKKEGTGPKPQVGQNVTVHCTGYGKNRDLKVPFWSTKDPGQVKYFPQTTHHITTRFSSNSIRKYRLAPSTTESEREKK